MKEVVNVKKSKIPIRICIGCGARFPKSLLNRYTLTGEGKLEQDVSGKVQGRGFYICNNLDCLNKARKKKVFEKYRKNQNVGMAKA